MNNNQYTGLLCGASFLDEHGREHTCNYYADVEHVRHASIGATPALTVRETIDSFVARIREDARKEFERQAKLDVVPLEREQ